jgi:thiol-disulfide isomerase/thioredoxin
MQKALALVSALLLSCTGFAKLAPSAADLACLWSAQLTASGAGASDSYLVPFDLSIDRTATGLGAALLNGSDRIEFSSIVQQGREVTLRLDQYDATLSAHCSSGEAACDALEGEYVRQKGSSLSHYRFSARCARPAPDAAHTAGSAADSAAHSEHNSAPHSAPQVSVAADWKFAFTDASGKPDSETNVAAHFTQEARHVEGTIAPVSGDYGMLSGELSEGKDAALHLSRFDGIHVLLLDGQLVSPDRIEGVFHVAAGRALNFVATRSASASAGFGEAEQLTSVENPSEPFRFHGVDASGSTITQNDPRFHGKVVLLDIFGTWCPNCHDEAPVLQALDTEFHARGLEIVGLSYEYVDDRERSQRLLEVYRRKYSIAFPLLLAGTTDAGQITGTLPQLRNFGAYPTTIFLDRHGRVRLIHAGFSGPATGRMEEVKQNFERTIVKLLDEQ